MLRPVITFKATIVWIAALFGLLLIGSIPAQAELTVDITRPSFAPMPIAVPNFHVEGQHSEETALLGTNMAQVISENLNHTGLFKMVDPQAYLDSADGAQKTPRFADWRLINAQALVTGTVKEEAGGLVSVQFRLWDVFGGEELVGRGYRTASDNWRRIAHMISDEIYERLTGDTGYFNTRVVYISENGPPNRRIKRLAIMDQDGANHRFLTDGSYLVLTPRFSPTGPEITYLSYIGNRPRVYLFNINTGRQEVLGDFPGMTFAPRFSPDGNSVIMSQSVGGDTDIFTMDLRTRRISRLTSTLGIDTGPSFSPDGERIVFESDRGGSQQIYVMPADGGDAKRISFGEGRYGNPVWSPRGDLIAFTKQHNGKFYIGVMHPDGSGERLITESYHVEGPTFSPNGRVLMYFKERPVGPGGTRREAKLYTIDITGANERRVETPMDASDPAWSPLIR